VREADRAVDEALQRVERARAWVAECAAEERSDTEHIAATNELAQAEADYLAACRRAGLTIQWVDFYDE
jgi:predicted YcjX-like family ATPase